MKFLGNFLARSTGHLYFWVLIGIVIGGLVGLIVPEWGVALKPLGDAFIALIKMLIGPVIFCTVVHGIAQAGDIKKVGRVGARALIYFEVVSTAALVIGLVVANLLKPGQGFPVDPAHLSVNAASAQSVAEFSHRASEQHTVDFFLHLIPKTFFSAFGGSGDLLQILLIAILFGYALNLIGTRGEIVFRFIESTSDIFMGMMNAVMKLAPIGAGGAMAYTLGKYGAEALRPLMFLMGCFYLTCALFILGVLGGVARLAGFRILPFLRYIHVELLTVLGTSSSESALVPLMKKLERLGCSRSVVGLVVPAGYSFNLDGTNIYLTLAILFVAQALRIDLSLTQQLSILAIAMVTSKGASGVTGAGFVTLAATLAVVPEVPVAGLALILGIDRFMSEARALTNCVGNGVATIVVSAWQGELDRGVLRRELRLD